VKTIDVVLGPMGQFLTSMSGTIFVPGVAAAAAVAAGVKAAAQAAAPVNADATLKAFLTLFLLTRS
jgi:hypothetical protein